MTSKTLTLVPPLRQSTAETMACPYSYAAQAIEGRATATTEPSYRGTEVHAVMRAYVKHCGERKVQADWAAFDQIAAAISPEAGRICDGMRDWFRVDFEHIIATEEKISLDSNFQPASTGVAAYQGTLDALYALNEIHALIRDYKSHPVPFEADTVQSVMYPVLVFQTLPWVQNVTFELVFVRYRNCMRAVTWSRADLPKMMAELSRYRERQLKMHLDYEASGIDALPAIPHAGCHFCPLLQFGDCPVAELNPHTQSPEDLTHELLFLDKRREYVKSILKSAVQARSGPIVVRDDNGTELSYGAAPSESRAYPAQTVLPVIQQWCTATGDHKFAESINLSSTTVSSKLDTLKRASLRHDVEPLMRKVTKVKLGLTTRNIGEAQPEEDW